MSLADIIMSGTAQGYSSLASGISEMGSGLAGGLTKMWDEQKQEKERKAKMRFLNAQADQMETSAKLTKNTLDAQTEQNTIIQQGTQNGKSPAEIADDLRRNVKTAHLADAYLDGRLMNDKKILANKTEKWQAATAKADHIGMQAMSIQDENGWNQMVEYFKANGVDIEAGMGKMTWEQKRDKLINSSKKVQDLIISQQRVAYEKGGNELERIQGKIRTLEFKEGELSPEQKKQLRDLKANETMILQKNQAIIDSRELNDVLKIEKRDQNYAKTARNIIANVWTDNEYDVIDQNRAMKRGEAKAIEYAVGLLKQGVPIETVKTWANDNLKLEEDSWYNPWDKDAVTFTPYTGSIPTPGQDLPAALEAPQVKQQNQERNLRAIAERISKEKGGTVEEHLEKLLAISKNSRN